MMDPKRGNIINNVTWLLNFMNNKRGRAVCWKMFIN